MEYTAGVDERYFVRERKDWTCTEGRSDLSSVMLLPSQRNRCDTMSYCRRFFYIRSVPQHILCLTLPHSAPPYTAQLRPLSVEVAWTVHGDTALLVRPPTTHQPTPPSSAPSRRGGLALTLQLLKIRLQLSVVLALASQHLLRMLASELLLTLLVLLLTSDMLDNLVLLVALRVASLVLAMLHDLRTQLLLANHDIVLETRIAEQLEVELLLLLWRVSVLQRIPYVLVDEVLPHLTLLGIVAVLVEDLVDGADGLGGEVVVGDAVLEVAGDSGPGFLVGQIEDVAGLPDVAALGVGHALESADVERAAAFVGADDVEDLAKGCWDAVRESDDAVGLVGDL